jgi:hypothetical protein
MFNKPSKQDYKIALEKVQEELHRGFVNAFKLYNEELDSAISVYNRELSYYRESKDTMQKSDYNQKIDEIVRNFKTKIVHALGLLEDRLGAGNCGNKAAIEYWYTVQEEVFLKIYRAIDSNNPPMPTAWEIKHASWAPYIDSALRRVY